jgi:hypothetical protein
MNGRLHVIRLASVAALVGLVVLSQTGGCDCAPCPEPARFESGNYEIVGLAFGQPEPESQWLLDTVIGAAVVVD